jgi:hypothetical protein
MPLNQTKLTEILMLSQILTEAEPVELVAIAE